MKTCKCVICGGPHHVRFCPGDWPDLGQAEPEETTKPETPEALRAESLAPTETE